MAKNRKSTFNMLPDDVQASIVTQEQPVTQKNDVTSVTHKEYVTQPSNVTQPTQVEYIPQPIQPQQAKPIAQVQLPIQTVMPKQPKTRVYVNIKTENYEYLKKECGAIGMTLQDFFDARIEEYRRTNPQHFVE